MLEDIREGADKLFIWFQIKVLLVLEISDGSGEVEVSVDSSFRDESSGLSDSMV